MKISLGNSHFDEKNLVHKNVRVLSRKEQGELLGGMSGSGSESGSDDLEMFFCRNSVCNVNSDCNGGNKNPLEWKSICTSGCKDGLKHCL